MAKVILLVRVSTQHQDLIQQTEKVKEEAIRQGYKEDDIILIADKESAVKLSEEERNGLNQLKNYISSDDSINCVITYEISRISRQAKIVFSIRDYLIEHGVQLIVMNPYFKMLKDDGTLSETSNIFFGIFASMAENEGYIRKARLKRGIAKKKALGKWTGHALLTGYAVDNDDNYIIDPVKGPIIVEIFERYAYEHESLRTLARELEREGKITSTDIAFTIKKLSNILKNDAYIGKSVYPRLITDELWNVVRRKTELNKTGPKFRKIEGDRQALCKGILREGSSGFLFTLKCGVDTKYVINSRREGKKSITVKQEIIEPIVWDAAVKIHKQFSQPSQEKEKAKLVVKRDRVISQVDTAKDKISKLNDKIDKIEERWLDGKITSQKRDAMREQCEIEIKSLEETINKLNEELTKLTSFIKNYDVIEEVDYDNLDFDARYKLVHDTINVVTIDRGPKSELMVNVISNFSDTPFYHTCSKCNRGPKKNK